MLMALYSLEAMVSASTTKTSSFEPAWAATALALKAKKLMVFYVGFFNCVQSNLNQARTYQQ
jgi:hypothetical protein